MQHQHKVQKGCGCGSWDIAAKSGDIFGKFAQKLTTIFKGIGTGQK